MCVVCGEQENLQTDQSIMSSSLLEFSVLYGVHVDPHQPFHVGAPQFKQFRIQEKEDRGSSLVSEMVGLAQSEVCTHIGCSVALKGAAIDVECSSIVVDGPSLGAVCIQV
jgi:hypothetical protein